MTQYRFKIGDMVREKDAENGITGKVVDFGHRVGCDWYTVESDGCVYNADDSELELVRRCPSFDNPNVIMMETLVWYTAAEKPREGELCRLILDHDRSDEWTGRFNGEFWEAGIADEWVLPIMPDTVLCWSSFDPPCAGEEAPGEEDWACGVGQAFNPD